MRVLLTGATGYTGRGIAEVLREAGHWVRGLDVRADESVALDAMSVASLGDLDACRSAADGVDAAVLCHMAPNPVAYEAPPMAFDVNVTGTANLFHALVEKEVPRAVLVSSRATLVAGAESAVVGQGPYPYDRKGLYGLTKILQEHLCRYYHDAHGMAIAVLRPSYIVYDKSLINKYGDRLTRYGPSLIDPRDIGKAACSALDLADLGLEAFDLGQDDDTIDLSRSHDRLGWRPQYRFQTVPRPQPKDEQAG